MRREHLDIAIEQYIFWRELGFDHGEMLAAVSNTLRESPTAGEVVIALAEAADEMERELRWLGLDDAA